jgi:DNA modification methylase
MSQNYKKIKISCKGADLLPIDSLEDFQGGLKKISKSNLNKLKKRIIRDGINVPLFVWRTDDLCRILDGHQRLKALFSLREDGHELPMIPVAYIDAADEKDARQKLLGITSQFGEFEIEELEEWMSDLDDDIAETVRFTDTEIIIDTMEETEGDDELPDEVEEVSKPGDLWELGNHRVLCGDSTKIEDVEKLMAGKKINLIFSDPPYGIDVVQNDQVGGDGPTKFEKTNSENIVKSSTYKKIEGDQSIDVSKDFYNLCIKLGFKNIILWGGNYFTEFLHPSNCWIIWDKEMTGNFSQAEMAWTSFSKGGIKIFKHLWNGLSREGNRKDELKSRVHPTQKPVGLFSKIFKKFDGFKIIFDGFLGSGSTLIACEKTNRICYGMETDPHYCDIIVNRYINWCQENDREYSVKLNGKKFNAS